MDSVMLWCVKYVLQRSQSCNGLCVDPKLEQQVELLMSDEVRWWDEKSQRKIKDEAAPALHYRLSQTHRQVELFRTMVNLMLGPQNMNFCKFINFLMNVFLVHLSG